MITLWGPTSSGKTALLSSLYLKPQGERSDWVVYPTDLSLPEINRQSERISKANEFPYATGGTEEVPISYRFKNRKTNIMRTMKTIDRPGMMSIQNDPVLIKALVESEGIVLLLDHGRPQLEIEVVQTLTSMYVERCFSAGGVEGEPDPRPMSVCLSKVDRFIHNAEDLRRIRGAPERFVKEELSQGLLDRLAQYHSNVRFFPVSSVGLNLNYGCIRKPVFFDEKLVLRVTEGNPMNVIEPFVWILDQLGEAA